MDYNISDAFACYTDKRLEELFFSNYKEELFKLNSTIYDQTAVNLQFEDLFSLFHSLWDYCDIGKQTNSVEHCVSCYYRNIYSAISLPAKLNS